MTSPTPLLTFQDVCFRYDDGHEALSHVSFKVHTGESIALIGANGAGKSTLLLHTNGTHIATAGSVFVGAETITPKNLTTARQTVGLVFQNPDDQLFLTTVEQDVAFGPQNMGLSAAQVEARVAEALAATNTTALRKRFSHKLSGGEKRRVALATVLAMDPDVLVFDEPSAHLDPASRRRFINLMKTMPHAKIIATHDLCLALDICERTVVLHNGSIVFDGKTTEVFANPETLYRWDLELPLCLGERPCVPPKNS
jgi:cobalt/nickel transport system ATP-binding protein